MAAQADAGFPAASYIALYIASAYMQNFAVLASSPPALMNSPRREDSSLGCIFLVFEFYLDIQVCLMLREPAYQHDLLLWAFLAFAWILESF